METPCRSRLPGRRTLWLVVLPATLLTAQAPAGAATISAGFTVSDAGPGWTSEFEFPALDAELDWVMTEVMEDMRKIVTTFAANAEEDSASLGEDPLLCAWIMEGGMTLMQAPEGFLTASLTWWEYWGRARGFEGTRLYRYALSVRGNGSCSWEAIGTEDILADSAELVALSELVMDSLAVMLGPEADMDWIREGAGPEWGNYSMLRPVPDSTGALAGFSTLFPSYSVAHHAYGSQEVFIPIGLLRP